MKRKSANNITRHTTYSFQIANNSFHSINGSPGQCFTVKL